MTKYPGKTQIAPATTVLKWIVIYVGAWTLFVSAPAFALGGFEPMLISAIIGGLLGGLLAVRGVFAKLGLVVVLCGAATWNVPEAAAAVVPVCESIVGETGAAEGLRLVRPEPQTCQGWQAARLAATCLTCAATTSSCLISLVLALFDPEPMSKVYAVASAILSCLAATESCFNCKDQAEECDDDEAKWRAEERIREMERKIRDAERAIERLMECVRNPANPCLIPH